MTYFIHCSFPARGQKVPGTRREKLNPIAQQCPPKYECVPKIPQPEGNYARVLQDLANRAFYLAVAQGRFVATLSSPKPPKRPNRRITGYRAYMLYMWSTYWRGISLPDAEKLARTAWASCPHKHIWEYYAAIYNLFRRTVGFLCWLDMVSKSGDNCFINFGSGCT